MDAPRVAVVDKLLHAHKVRSKKMIEEYMPPDAPKPVLTGHQAYAYQQQQLQQQQLSVSKQQMLEEHLQSVASARKFHQTMIVGLVEATKGISELYDLGKAQAATTPSTASLNTSNNSVSKQDVAREEVEAYIKLHASLSELAPRCTDCLVRSMKMFFARYNAHVHHCNELETNIAAAADARSKAAQKPAPKRAVDPSNPFGDDDEEDVHESEITPEVELTSTGKPLSFIYF
jgi:hypothetical protein